MKVIFLDFDGVIAPCQYHFGSTFSKSACSNLQEILTKDTEARIVISSSWRRFGLEKNREILKENGIDSSKIIDLTTSEGGWEPENRVAQIDSWLKNHKKIDNYLVLDDYPMPKFDNNCVKTNSYIGLTKKDVEIALAILNQKN